MRNKLWILRLLCVCFEISRNGCAASSAFTTTARNLYTSMTFGYNAEIRPDTNVPVSVSLAVSTINVLDTQTEQFSVTGWFSVSWTDSSYGWNPSSYSNIEYLFLSKDYCWRPQIAIYNAVDDIQILNDDEQQIRMKSDGTVLWEPGGVFTVNCTVDVSDFPFDKQTCSLSLSSLVYDDTEVTISHYTDTIKLDGVKNNAEWTVTDTSTETGGHLDGRNDFSKRVLRFTFKLERNSSFYVWTLLVPYFLISCLGLVVFIIPPMNGEKLSFSMKIILLVSLYFIIFSTLIAKPTGTFPTIGIYFFFLLIINVMELLTTVGVERLHRNEREERPVPESVQTMARDILATISCYRSRVTRNDMDYVDHDRRIYPKRFSMPKNTRVSPSSLQSVSPPAKRPRNPTSEFDRIKSAASTRTTNSDVTVTTDDSNASSSMPLQSRATEYSWNDIASMVDRICLAVLLFLVAVLTTVVMAILFS